VQLEGDNFPPGPLASAAASALQMVFMGGMLCALAGSFILPDAAKRWIDDNKMMFFGGVFMANMLSSALVQTGAFEVYIDGQLKHSKIETGLVPDFSQVAGWISAALRK